MRSIKFCSLRSGLVMWKFVKSCSKNKHVIEYPSFYFNVKLKLGGYSSIDLHFGVSGCLSQCKLLIASITLDRDVEMRIRLYDENQGSVEVNSPYEI